MILSSAVRAYVCAEPIDMRNYAVCPVTRS
jgi:hypothetical protein